MNERYEALFTPWKIGNVEIKNRIVLCPMGGTSLFGWMEPNHFDREAANFFLERARNNVGLIIPGIAPIRDTLGGRWLYRNRKMFRQLKDYMEEIHATGAKLFVQLTAGMGRSWGISDEVMILHKNPVLKVLAKPILDTDYQLASPSPLPSRWAEGVTCPQMTVAQIQEIVAAFAKTAVLCKEAGVDGVEVHAVHEGYLLDQFALKYTNHRTDGYGGSFENRYRFAVDILKAIKAACGADYPVSLRYSAISKVKDFCYGALPGEEYAEIGRDREESLRAARYLQDAGYDMLDADNGTYDSWYWSHPPMYMPLNCNLEDVAAIRKVVDIPVVCAGRMEPDTAAQAIQEGRIDAMGVARQFLADGEWVTKLLEDRLEEMRPCICCHNGCFNLSHYKGHANAQSLPDTRGMARCALEPRTMQSRKYRITPAAKTKRVAVIGGGVGCAIAYPLAKALHEQGTIVHTVTGFRNRDLVILEEAFTKVSDRYELISDDGSTGRKGLVTDVLREWIEQGERYDEVIAIGPLAMMKFVSLLTKRYGIKTIVSMNPIMIDGTGMCGGCRISVGGEVKFACVDGPDFDGHLVDFDEAISRSATYRAFEARKREEYCQLMGKKEA